MTGCLLNLPPLTCSSCLAPLARALSLRSGGAVGERGKSASRASGAAPLILCSQPFIEDEDMPQILCFSKQGSL